MWRKPVLVYAISVIVDGFGEFGGEVGEIIYGKQKF